MLKLADLIQKLNEIAGKHGVGRIDHVENRLVGIKSREIYECPGAVTLLTAHKEIEDLTLVREVAHFKPIIENELSNLIYNALWFSSATQALIAYIKETQKVVNGTAKSNCIRGALRSWLGNHQILFTMKIWRRILVQIPLTKMRLLALLSYGDFQPRFILRFKKAPNRTIG